MLLSDWLNVGEGRKPQREVGGALVMVDLRVPGGFLRLTAGHCWDPGGYLESDMKY